MSQQVVATMADMAPMVFEMRDGKLYRRGDWQLCIEIAGSLLDLAAEGGCAGLHVAGSFQLSGSIVTDTRYTSVTFVCENGEATYDILEQEPDDFRRDVWRGVRRSAVESVMESLA